MDLETNNDRRANFNRRNAHLSVALCEVPIACRKERAPRKHRKQKLGALSQLLDVEISTVLPKWDGSQSFETATPEGTALASDGGITRPPASSARCSRSVHSFSFWT